ncbi:prolyl-tRNA synthetase [Annulohypoxylon maeteangense]|uniref:prolyl-tRNA synthetase n=1 Tax=Annulohypoxylon maeteangense TaxID=1927788 RepID=UPI002007A449|nr:prolyl-tRNA synthetase [Annulohypoxylon maeteangense]KAI0889474.1 prolyl-tRNA synthetase [Annulohypoxylon maeteangense]
MIPLSRIPRRNHVSAFKCSMVYGTRPYSDLRGPVKYNLDQFHKQDPFIRQTRFGIPASQGLQARHNETTHDKLMRAGYLRQSHSGVHHMLPLGLRVEEKLQALIDKYMLQIGASKMSLSSISRQSLWEKTNRLAGYGQELFRFRDRKDAALLLAPTHEEEITALVSESFNSYKQLPLKLYQIGRKYRDEFRPRAGLLRSKEFLMKDLYTFDYSVELALSTYEEARAAYSRLFDELKLPILCAEASSGDIGGDKSHEYHLPSSLGEDFVVRCSSCDYVANEEVASTQISPPEDNKEDIDWSTVSVWRGVSKDRETLINVWYPASFKGSDINTHAIKAVFPELDSSLDDSIPFWSSAPPNLTKPRESLRIMNIVDFRLGPHFTGAIEARLKSSSSKLIIPKDSDINVSDTTNSFILSSADGSLLNVIHIRDGDTCPRCESGKLDVQKAIELGHTFFLGTKYSQALNASVDVPSHLLGDEAMSSKPGGVTRVHYQMGCHGIGVSRMIAAIADHLVDEKGLNWPRAIAPFEVVLIPNEHSEEDNTTVLQHLTEPNGPQPFDIMLDDRNGTIPWKLKDADLIGYPVIVLLGKKWTASRLAEVQCRRLKSKEFVPLEDIRAHVEKLLSQL